MKPFVSKELKVDGTRLLFDSKPFYLQGLSFFNAIYNPNFNRSSEERMKWMLKFRENGVNTLRIWCQWGFKGVMAGFADMCPGNTMYTDDGEIVEMHFKTLEEIIILADNLDMVIEVVLFTNEYEGDGSTSLSVAVQERAAGNMAERLKAFRNVIMQIWNEFDMEVVRHFEKIKSEDSERIVTNCASWGNDCFGPDNECRLLDILTPHTIRTHQGRFWELAAGQIAYALEKYKKPIIDDEPARCGSERTMIYGGIQGGTQPEQHIEQIKFVRSLGGYHIYHHDMYQLGYGDPSVPPHGIPDPDFSTFHRKVFDYMRDNRTW